MTARFPAKVKADYTVPLGALAEAGLPASGLQLASSRSFASGPICPDRPRLHVLAREHLLELIEASRYARPSLPDHGTLDRLTVN